MEVIVTLVRLIYHDASCIRLKLEIADAVKFYVSHHVWKHLEKPLGIPKETIRAINSTLIARL